MQEQEQKSIKSYKRYISIISNVLLAVGAGIGLFVLAKAYLFNGPLPAGSCPLTLNQSWLYFSMALLLLSFVLSFFEPKKQKNVE